MPRKRTVAIEMAAYLLIDIASVHDPVAYADYRARVSAGLAAAGGRYIVRGGPVEVLEGTWQPGRVVVVRFESADAARRWWSSDAYAALRDLRQASTTTHMVLVEGVADE
ncbi:MAG TPA: DUF1330 domain-containing protein [Vicinamibacterales bacterium]|nr:DUF1330 domain-containing protein [Vicinamibacterales bacterium]